MAGATGLAVDVSAPLTPIIGPPGQGREDVKMNRYSQSLRVLLLRAFLLVFVFSASTEAADPGAEKGNSATKKRTAESQEETPGPWPGIPNMFDETQTFDPDIEAPRSAAPDVAARNELKMLPPLKSSLTKPVFNLNKVNDNVVVEFKKAWRVSKSGTLNIEGVVLVFQNLDGSYYGKSQGTTNQYKAFTFVWDPAAIAIVHTHPNSSDPRPQQEDLRIADRFGVPIFTITSRGMYMYDPATKKITRVMNGLDWLEYPRGYQRVARR
jgi:hypothetical protein